MIFQTVEKGKEGKETSEKKLAVASHASLRSKVQATRRMPQKRGGDRARRRVSERHEASLADHPAESAALSAQTPLFHLK
ncbi:MAG: hypothetical protein ACLVJ8_13760 [Ruthenibacterium lactatiformans]